MKFKIEFEGKIYDCEWFDKTNFKKLEREKVRQCYGFVFDKEERLCIINCGGKQGWCLPGGTVEIYDKTFKDTLIREVNEEADLDLKDIKKVGYIKIIPKENPREIHYALRYVAKVKKIKPQTIDPACNIIPKRKFILPSEFIDYVNWGENGKFQLQKALNVYKTKTKKYINK